MLKKDELNKISESIRNAESNTSGEIRVYLSRHCKGEPLEEAYKRFRKLKMGNTQLRNGVLIYISIIDHKAAIFADEGIKEAVGNKEFWNEALYTMLFQFKNNEIRLGISKGIEKVGELLKELYPKADDDKNELDNDVIIEE